MGYRDILRCRHDRCVVFRILFCRRSADIRVQDRLIDHQSHSDTHRDKSACGADLGSFSLRIGICVDQNILRVHSHAVRNIRICVQAVDRERKSCIHSNRSAAEGHCHRVALQCMISRHTDGSRSVDSSFHDPGGCFAAGACHGNRRSYSCDPRSACGKRRCNHLSIAGLGFNSHIICLVHFSGEKSGNIALQAQNRDRHGNAHCSGAGPCHGDDAETGIIVIFLLFVLLLVRQRVFQEIGDRFGLFRRILPLYGGGGSLDIYIPAGLQIYIFFRQGRHIGIADHYGHAGSDACSTAAGYGTCDHIDRQNIRRIDMDILFRCDGRPRTDHSRYRVFGIILTFCLSLLRGFVQLCILIIRDGLSGTVYIVYGCFGAGTVSASAFLVILIFIKIAVFDIRLVVHFVVRVFLSVSLQIILKRERGTAFRRFIVRLVDAFHDLVDIKAVFQGIRRILLQLSADHVDHDRSADAGCASDRGGACISSDIPGGVRFHKDIARSSVQDIVLSDRCVDRVLDHVDDRIDADTGRPAAGYDRGDFRKPVIIVCPEGYVGSADPGCFAC